VAPSDAPPPFEELLAALAARTPAPAGGCGAAWAGALAAALLEMVAKFAERADVAARGGALRRLLLDTAQVDQRAYLPVIEAIRLPREQPDRDVILRRALAEAAEPPLVVAEAASEIAMLAAEVRAALRPAVREDAVASVLLADGAVRTAARLVLANLEGQDAPGQRRRLEDAVERVSAAVATVDPRCT
jgi:formiminotetrahydrofolate cyclodeaminase